MGDRSYGFSGVDIDFLGAPARFPIAAFKIAAAAGCPVVVALPAKISARAYELDIAAVFEPAYAAGPDQATQLRQWVQDYARVLEAYLERFPLQCFLFHDVWREAARPEMS
jgi:predicted LPLAT superfamily acyltransferase